MIRLENNKSKLSYTKLNMYDNEENIDEIQRLFNVYKIKCNLRHLIRDAYPEDYFPDDFNICDFGKLVSVLHSTFSKVNISEEKEQLLINNNINAMREFVSFKTWINSPSVVKLKYKDINNVVDVYKGEKKPNLSVWKSAFSDDSIMGYNIEFTREESQNETSYYAIFVKRSSTYRNLIRISTDIAVYSGRKSFVEKRHLSFKHLQLMYIDLEDGVTFVPYDIQLNPYKSDTFDKYPVNMLNFVSTDSCLLKTKNNSSCFVGLKVDFNSYFVNEEGLVDLKPTDICLSRVFLLTQGTLKTYTTVKNTVMVVKRESTAKRRLTEINGVDAIDIEDDSIKGTEDKFIKLSSLAVKRVYERKEWQGGHHSSPVPHDVSEHVRHYKNGKEVVIKGYHKNSPKYTGSVSGSNKVVIMD